MFDRITFVRNFNFWRITLFTALETAIEQCRLAANNGVHTVVVDIGYVELIDFSLAFHQEMGDNAMTYSTVGNGKNFNEVIMTGILPE